LGPGHSALALFAAHARRPDLAARSHIASGTLLTLHPALARRPWHPVHALRPDLAALSRVASGSSLARKPALTLRPRQASFTLRADGPSIAVRSPLPNRSRRSICSCSAGETGRADLAADTVNTIHAGRARRPLRTGRPSRAGLTSGACWPDRTGGAGLALKAALTALTALAGLARKAADALTGITLRPRQAGHPALARGPLRPGRTDRTGWAACTDWSGLALQAIIARLTRGPLRSFVAVLECRKPHVDQRAQLGELRYLLRTQLGDGLRRLRGDQRTLARPHVLLLSDDFRQQDLQAFS
jgi:hypothetical protein